MKYKKKVVTVEAVHFKDYSEAVMHDVFSFMHKEPKDLAVEVAKAKDRGGIWVKTPEHIVLASVGDYIIKGVHGEYYPCKADIFHETYDPVG